MTATENAAIVHRYFEECVSGASGRDPDRALAILDDLLTDDFVMAYNNDTDAEATRGRDAHKEFLIEHARVFPDDQWTVEELVANGDVVACHWRIQATYAETGNPIDVHAADFFNVRDGRLAELHRFLDFRSLRRQQRATTGQL